MHKFDAAHKQNHHQHVDFHDFISTWATWFSSRFHTFRQGALNLLSTLQVVEGVCGRGLLRRSLGDGFEVGAVALQDGGHEAKEGLLDFHLQGRLLLLPGEVRLNGGHVHCRAILGRLTHWNWNTKKFQTVEIKCGFFCTSLNYSFD